jgi:site-specific DNA-adenine methylase
MLKKLDWGEFLNNLKGSIIRFNPRPWSNPRNFESKTLKDVDEKLVNFHVEVAQKVDTLLKHLKEQEHKPEVWRLPTSINDVDSSPDEILNETHNNINNR